MTRVTSECALKRGNTICPNKPDEWEFMPNVLDTLRKYAFGAERFLGIVTNQGGVRHGYLTAYDVSEICNSILEALHLWLKIPRSVMGWKAATEDNFLRKPKPGMLWSLMMFFEVGRSTTLMVGDMDADYDAAIAAGVDFVWAWDFFGFEKETWLAYAKHEIPSIT